MKIARIDEVNESIIIVLVILYGNFVSHWSFSENMLVIGVLLIALALWNILAEIKKYKNK